MKCKQCQRSDVLLFPAKDQTHICSDCSKVNALIGSEINEQIERHFPSYVLKWRLRDTNGKHWIEEMECMTLSDFEIVYANNVHEILWLKMRQEGVAIL